MGAYHKVSAGRAGEVLYDTPEQIQKCLSCKNARCMNCVARDKAQKQKGGKKK